MGPKYKKQLITLSAVAFIGFGWILYNHFSTKASHISEYIGKEEAHLQVLMQEISGELSSLKQSTIDLVDFSIKQGLDSASLLKKMHATIDSQPKINGIQVAYLPGKFKADSALFSPYLYRNDSLGVQQIQIENDYDYTRDGGGVYFQRTMEIGSSWQEPYFAQGNKEYLLEYCHLMMQESDTLGVACLNYRYDEISNRISLKSQNSASYLSVIAPSGYFVFHPTESLVKERKNVNDIIAENDNTGTLERAFKESKEGKSGIVPYTSPVSAQVGWLIYDRLEITGWAMHLVMDGDSIPSIKTTLRHQMFWLITLAMFGLFFLCFAFLNTGPLRAFLIVVLMILGNIVIWGAADLLQESEPELILDNASALENLKAQHHSLADSLNLEGLHHIATGIFVETIEKEGASRIHYTGFIWQKYPADWRYEKDFVLPKSVELEKEILSEYKEDDGTIIQWRFSTNVIQNLNYIDYPLDRDELQILIRHPRFNSNILLVPDLDSYEYLTPSQKPGLSSDAFLTGFALERSFFSFLDVEDQAYFGPTDIDLMESPPMLQFNIEFRRQVVNAIIAHTIPLGIIFSLLYLLLLMTEPKKKDFSLNILAACSGLFFVAIFDHIGLRNDLSVNNFIYFDSLYFLCYFNILLITIVSYLHSYPTLLFHWRGDLVKRMELIYWPMNLGLVYLVAFFAFY